MLIVLVTEYAVNLFNFLKKHKRRKKHEKHKRRKKDLLLGIHVNKSREKANENNIFSIVESKVKCNKSLRISRYII